MRKHFMISGQTRRQIWPHLFEGMIGTPNATELCLTGDGHAWSTNKASDVTCPHCLASLADPKVNRHLKRELADGA